jgi:hypothetical protein
LQFGGNLDGVRPDRSAIFTENVQTVQSLTFKIHLYLYTTY